MCVIPRFLDTDILPRGRRGHHRAFAPIGDGTGARELSGRAPIASGRVSLRRGDEPKDGPTREAGNNRQGIPGIPAAAEKKQTIKTKPRSRADERHHGSSISSQKLFEPDQGKRDQYDWDAQKHDDQSADILKIGRKVMRIDSPRTPMAPRIPDKDSTSVLHHIDIPHPPFGHELAAAHTRRRLMMRSQ